MIEFLIAAWGLWCVVEMWNRDGRRGREINAADLYRAATRRADHDGARGR